MRTNFLANMQYSWVAAGASVVTAGVGVYKVVKGNSNAKKAKRARERLAKPLYQIQDEYYQNKNLASEMAQGGLPVATKDYYTQESQRGLGAGIKGILGSGGNPNDIQNIFSAYDDGIGKIGAADAKAHLDNIQYYMGVNKDLAGQKTIKWAIDKQQPYLNTLKQLSDEQFQGKAMANQGISDVAGAATSFATSYAGGSGAGGFGKASGGSTASMGKVGGGGSSDSFNNSFSRVFANDNEANSVNTNNVSDPFGNQNNEYEQYLQWKRFNGK